jgi:hypothetical protein
MSSQFSDNEPGPNFPGAARDGEEGTARLNTEFTENGELFKPLLLLVLTSH